jgi:hypothetical protein
MYHPSYNIVEWQKEQNTFVRHRHPQRSFKSITEMNRFPHFELLSIPGKKSCKANSILKTSCTSPFLYTLGSFECYKLQDCHGYFAICLLRKENLRKKSSLPAKLMFLFQPYYMQFRCAKSRAVKIQKIYKITKNPNSQL